MNSISGNIWTTYRIEEYNTELRTLLQNYYDTDFLGKNQRIQHGLQKHPQIYNAAGANENKPTQLYEQRRIQLVLVISTKITAQPFFIFFILQ